MPENSSSFLRSSVLVLVAAFGLGGAVVAADLLVPDRTMLATPSAQAQLLDATQPFAISDVAERVLPAVVSVTTKIVREMPEQPFPGFPFFDMGPQQRRESTGEGSGVIVDAGKGLIVTNNHVVEAANEIVVTLADGTDIPAEIVGTDFTTDVAVLRLTPEGKMPKLSEITVGNSDTLRLGEVVLAVGNPFGFSGTVTMGIVSAKGRADTQIVQYGDFIQTDAAINPGHSGGALVNMRGELVGVNTAIATGGMTRANAGIGFAIPTSIVMPIMDSLIMNGRVARGFLGISMQDLDDPAVAESLGAKGRQGVIVADIVPDSPADAAGLEPGDVVLAIDGEKVDSIGRMRTEVALRPAGKKVSLDILRGGKERTVAVKLGEQPKSFFANMESLSPSAKPAEPEALDGLVVMPLDDRARSSFNIEDDVVGGVVVAKVVPGTSAQRAGLRPGDVVIELNRKPVQSVKDFEKRWSASGSSAMLRVKRGQGTLFIVVGR